VRHLLVLSGGHPYEAEPFAALLGSLQGWRVEHLVHPEAEALVADGGAEQADALLFYDMPGFTFADGTVTTRPPSPGFVAAIEAHFARGGGAVAMHHALAGWADWPDWAEMLGGKFLYRRETLRGRQCLDSGYLHDVDYDAVVLADHPVTHGLPARFAMCDELYLAEIFAEDVTPLIAADHAFAAHNFYSADVRQFGLAAPARQRVAGMDEAGRRGAPRVPAIRRWPCGLCPSACAARAGQCAGLRYMRPYWGEGQT
jgi:hypothetical protein